MRVKDKITTSQLLTMIKNSTSFEAVSAYYDDVGEPTFHDVLYEMMDSRGIRPVDLISLTGIERTYFYHILNGTKKPGRNMVLRCGLALQMTLAETNRLLQLAGCSALYSRIRRDAVLIFAVNNKYTMEQANELLQQEGEEPLYR